MACRSPNRNYFVFSINVGRLLHTTTSGLNDIAATNPAAVVPNDNLWHHVAVVHTSGYHMRFYVDGNLGHEVAYVRGPGARTSATISVGGTVGNQNNIFTGTLDRIRVTKARCLPPSSTCRSRSRWTSKATAATTPSAGR